MLRADFAARDATIAQIYGALGVQDAASAVGTIAGLQQCKAQLAEVSGKLAAVEAEERMRQQSARDAKAGALLSAAVRDGRITDTIKAYLAGEMSAKGAALQFSENSATVAGASEAAVAQIGAYLATLQPIVKPAQTERTVAAAAPASSEYVARMAARAGVDPKYIEAQLAGKAVQ
jgi:hypothetical protein